MSISVVFERLMALVSVIATLIGSISFNTNFDRPDDEIRFTINANTTTSEALPNVVNNVNIWSIEGNPFKDAKVNSENNIFEFVEYVQFMQCSGGTEARDLFIKFLIRLLLEDY